MAIDTGSMLSQAISAYQTASKSSSSTASTATTSKYGKTIGNVELSEEASSYYEELKNKFSDMEFVLVSNDETDNVEQKAASYANSDKIVVLIDAAKIEQMAADEDYRNKYETIIENAKTQFDQMEEQASLTGNSDNVQGYGIRVNADGSTSFFAVLKQQNQAQLERIEAHKQEVKEENRAKEKKADRQEQEDRNKEIKAKRQEAAARYQKTDDDSETTELSDQAKDKTSYKVIEGNSIEDLFNRMTDYYMEERTNTVLSEAETYVGQTIDFRG